MRDARIQNANPKTSPGFGRRGRVTEPVRPQEPAFQTEPAAPKKRSRVLTYALLGAGALGVVAATRPSSTCQPANPNQPGQCTSGRSSFGFVYLGSTGTSSASQQHSAVTRSGFGSTGSSMSSGS